MLSVQPKGKQKGCAGCNRKIKDRYLLKALDKYWHEDCLKCACCDCRLGEVGSTLYTKANLILCRRDYLRWAPPRPSPPCHPLPRAVRLRPLQPGPRPSGPVPAPPQTGLGAHGHRRSFPGQESAASQNPGRGPLGGASRSRGVGSPDFPDPSGLKMPRLLHRPGREPGGEPDPSRRASDLGA